MTKEAHPLLNSEAPETIKRVEFDPAVEGGESVKFRMTLPVVFSLTTMPTGLTGSQTDDQVSLSWNGDPEDELSGFNVYRSTNAFDTTANAQKINEGLVEDTPYEDSDLTGGTTYYYRLTGVESNGDESLLSAQVTPSLQDLQLLGLEVNQSVQTWENDITPLVEGKKTIVRAHLQNKKEGKTPVNVKLRGTRNGSSLPDSPKSAFNADNFEAPPSPPSEDSVETIRERRADMSKSLNFELPSKWPEGTVTLKLVGDGIDCDKTPAVDANCEIEVTFERIDPPKITFFDVHWTGLDFVTREPNYNIDNIKNRITSMYPIKNANFSDGGVLTINCIVSSLCASGPPETEDVLQKIRNQLEEDISNGYIDGNHIYYGFIKSISDEWGEPQKIRLGMLPLRLRNFLDSRVLLHTNWDTS